MLGKEERIQRGRKKEHGTRVSQLPSRPYFRCPRNLQLLHALLCMQHQPLAHKRGKRGKMLGRHRFHERNGLLLLATKKSNDVMDLQPGTTLEGWDHSILTRTYPSPDFHFFCFRLTVWFLCCQSLTSAVHEYATLSTQYLFTFVFTVANELVTPVSVILSANNGVRKPGGWG